MLATLLRAAIGTAGAAAMILAAASFGVSQALGAHPIWATSMALIGVPLGLILALASTRLPRTSALIAFTILTALAFGAASWGKSAFAASFAENRLAGQVWYYGWIATAACATATLTALFARR